MVAAIGRGPQRQNIAAGNPRNSKGAGGANPGRGPYFAGSQTPKTRTFGGPATSRKMGPLREQTQCRFCRRGVKYVDYKDIETLSKLLTHRGKIYSRKRSGNCAGCQRKVKRAIKRARFMALLPFTT